jgi:hypothetical protein
VPVQITDVAVGSEHTLFLNAAGEVYGKGMNAVGQLGLGQHVESAPMPQLIASLVAQRIVKISAGDYHSAVRCFCRCLFLTVAGGQYRRRAVVLGVICVWPGVLLFV